MEYSRHGFCEILPADIRSHIEMMAPQFLAETWPVRFVALMSMLEEMAGQVAADNQPFIVNDWVIVVTGLLEHLPRDMESPECLALMRMSVLERFRQSAERQAPDVEGQLDLLRCKYAQWSIVEDLMRNYEMWAARQVMLKPH